MQEAVAPPARRPAYQSTVDATALYPYATPQPPTGLYSLQRLRYDASGALARALRLPNSSLAALYPHWHCILFKLDRNVKQLHALRDSSPVA